MKSKFNFFLSLSIISCIGLSAKCQSTNHSSGSETTVQMAFYNVENLFDTINDPAINDEEFLPGAKKQWNSAKYFEKLTHLSAVIDSLNPASGGPQIIGLCEVENRSVLEDLINQKNLSANTYKIVHQDSPDSRGIDVACLYNSSQFKLISSRAIPVVLATDANFKTRDILCCEFNHIATNTVFYVYVNHWPSRSGGEKESEHKRMASATALLNDIQTKIPDYSNKNILIMGDMNDYPTNESVYTTLGAQETAKKAFLTNLMYEKHQSKTGTYYYKGEWGVLDNIIVSKSVLNYVTQSDAVIYKRDWMLYTTSSGEKAPSRSYSGDKYYSGYSDHLPVYVTFKLK